MSRSRAIDACPTSRWGLARGRQIVASDSRARTIAGILKNIESAGMSYWSRSGVVSLEAFDVTTVAKDAYSFHSSYKNPKRKHIPDPVMEQSSIATSREQHEQSLHKILSQPEKDARKERNRNKRRMQRQNDPSHQQRTNANGVLFATSHGPVHRKQAAAQAKQGGYDENEV